MSLAFDINVLHHMDAWWLLCVYRAAAAAAAVCLFVFVGHIQITRTLRFWYVLPLLSPSGAPRYFRASGSVFGADRPLAGGSSCSTPCVLGRCRLVASYDGCV